MSQNSRNLSLALFSLQLEVQNAGFGFTNEIQAFNFENRKLSVFLSGFENFFHEPATRKGDSDLSMVQFMLQNYQMREDLEQFKMQSKTCFTGEFNPTLKCSFANTKILSDLYKILPSSVRNVSNNCSVLGGLVVSFLKGLVKGDGELLGEEK
jgi:hypothetical protein